MFFKLCNQILGYRMMPWSLLGVSNAYFCYQVSRFRRTQNDNSRKIEMALHILQGIRLMNESRAALKKGTDKVKKAKKFRGGDSGAETDTIDKP